MLAPAKKKPKRENTQSTSSGLKDARTSTLEMEGAELIDERRRS